MAVLCLKVSDKDGNTIAVARDEDEVNLLCTRMYQKGDKITLESSEHGLYLWLSVDDALGKSLIYLNDSNLEYQIPFQEKRTNLSPKAFWGEKHLLSVKIAKKFEISTYRNLALNVNDQHQNTTYYPHATANVETRGESVFEAKNAIDGVTISSCHGEWPFASWGINKNPEAEIKIDFGRNVLVDSIVIYLRADFPHDNWWKNGMIQFSDGTQIDLSFEKTGKQQIFKFDLKHITWLKLFHLIQSEEPSPFPALTQIEVYGVDELIEE
ncbi:hypothetical protein C8E03_12023 [Lachnotalea glycerini]|uniref:Carbohydrate-binding protein n=1 Tax=Lachnotalea glycerini TaxID=1763509 RepID=A0A255IFV9_9FIRM|nr:carbohydrate-binding protein [Lachnotalea glycerini]PXV85051.1 hypothetical protein C8E03_12023 [Lachnotalea glycerini]RDY27241.1 carbohydrate-binding protein [Lachnotalea glycerini]